jgi:protein-L-isoaspartate(D-aspartate) O-methyltransferase
LRLKPEAIGVGMTSQRVRDRLIERLRSNGIVDERVLNAIRTVPRHLFVDEALAGRAYEDNALPIGHGQTISQPWVVAKMTEAVLAGIDPAALHAQPIQHHPLRTPPAGAETPAPRVLEVGTGSGYQAVVLAALGLQVYTVERIGDLLRTARKRFRSLGLNIRSKHDDGRIGWPEHAPYDAILVTAGASWLLSASTSAGGGCAQEPTRPGRHLGGAGRRRQRPGAAAVVQGRGRHHLRNPARAGGLRAAAVGHGGLT